MPLQADDILTKMMGLDSLDDLEQFVKSMQAKPLRKSLFELFDARAEYRHAQDWAEAVRICEALAMIGWGDRERVDAICDRDENQWHTRFLTSHGDCRFLDGNWTKRKLGFILHNPEYYSSPDRPDKPAVSWMTYSRLHAAEFQIVSYDALPSQRNCRRLCPLFLGGIGATDQTSKVVDELRVELSRILSTSIPCDAYGNGLKTLDVCFVTWSADGKLTPGLQVGRYTPKSELYRCYLNFERAFCKRSRRDQKEYIATNLIAAIEHVADLLQKKSVTYDIAALRADVVQVLAEWQALA